MPKFNRRGFLGALGAVAAAALTPVATHAEGLAQAKAAGLQPLTAEQGSWFADAKGNIYLFEQAVFNDLKKGDIGPAGVATCDIPEGHFGWFLVKGTTPVNAHG